uniref:Uncharacterized protein n=1 Tax=Cacopsylla melanoneura TaxID=428564 RepID=A0A8D8Y8E3_9HEMI
MPYFFASRSSGDSVKKRDAISAWSLLTYSGSVASLLSGSSVIPNENLIFLIIPSQCLTFAALTFSLSSSLGSKTCSLPPLLTVIPCGFSCGCVTVVIIGGDVLSSGSFTLIICGGLLSFSLLWLLCIGVYLSNGSSGTFSGSCCCGCWYGCC